MKIILLSALALLPLSVLAQNKQKTYTEEFKKEFMDACVGSATEGGDISEKMAKEYCACSFELLSKKYTMDEVTAISEKGEEESAAIMRAATQPCLDELVKKLKKNKD
ncbi:hypothetical protein [Edaphocola flava]|jgi:hypothetical protein|uniref:hypothetical protein n=1 Tax=Edaphocola flava TaxID=2499629 RepID=UPI00100B90DF|nr:hypothetical protein [Edaphocola flava]